VGDAEVTVAGWLDALEQFGQAVHFAWRTTLALPGAFLRPVTLGVQLFHVLIGGLPLAGTAGVVIGTVFWIHLREALRRGGPPDAVAVMPQALALAVVLEFGPITAGLITAGRSGASLGAELGSMRLTEQIDALEVMGRSPIRELVAPRVLACMLALPVLTVFICYLAIGAGFVAEVFGGSMGGRQYLNETLRLLVLPQVVPAVLKTVLFGYLVGLVGCWQGLTATGGTEGVGKAATRAVVVSIFAVMVANVVLVKAIQLLPGNAG
jgi:phospholipid/cholesterol/gamma-HCH transport system permease protein